MSSAALALLIACQAITLAIVAVLWHKVRRIHVFTFRVNDLLTQTHRETHALYAQLAALAALEKTLALAAPLPPMRGWAGSPDFLLQVAQHLLKCRPAMIAECSSGVSTLVAARCCQLNGQGHVYSLEHEEQYAEKTRSLLREHGLEAWATVIHAPLARGKDGLVWYQDDKLPVQTTQVDVLLVDGPPMAAAALARYPAMPRLLSRLAEDVTLFLDDADRPDEKLIVERWLRENPGFTVTHPTAEKGLAVLTRNPSTAS